MRRLAHVAFAALLLLGVLSPVAARELSLTIGDLRSAAFSARDIRAHLSGERLEALRLEIGSLSLGERTWRKVALACPRATLTRERIACSDAILQLDTRIPVAFDYALARKQLELRVNGDGEERLHVKADFGAKPIAIDAQLQAVRLDRLGPLLPPTFPAVKGGRAQGQITLRGDGLKAQLKLMGFSFADKAGLHAGERISGDLALSATRAAQTWRWTADVSWREGEVFWQPLFVAANGQRLQATGSWQDGSLQVQSAQLALPGIGTATLAARADAKTGAHAQYSLQARDVRLGPLYQALLKPMVEGTALSDLRVEGDGSFRLQWSDAGLTEVDVTLRNALFEDKARRFALFGLDGQVPWRREGATKGVLRFNGAELLKMPIGPTEIPLRLNGWRVALGDVRLPLLDGALTVRDFQAVRGDKGWSWRFGGELSPLSMEALSGALGWPVMAGRISGALPELRYRDGALAVDGALRIGLFNGTVLAQNLKLIDPFGRAPRLHTDLTVEGLDLELLTRRFDFGTITGRIDARVRDLELVDWQPVRFDASLVSSPGNYPREISQRAVQNISALGGAGAAAAIQRSFLRFFEEFGYQKLGLSCRLENNVCEMDGIERAPQGFVIVKGGGIPAITVIGYNRRVDWPELIARVRRVTQDNVKPIVK